MLSGTIADKITAPAYTLQPQTHADNTTALFRPDSIFVDLSALKISGKIDWNFPHAGTSQQIEKLTCYTFRKRLQGARNGTIGFYY